jgi:hypothetical protein
MIPIYHFIASLVLVAVLYPYFGAASLIVFLTGWLIDADHALYYVLKFRDFNWNRMYSYFREQKSRKKIINIFHTLEFYILIAVLSFYSTYFLIAAMGLFVHVAMDIMHNLASTKYCCPRYRTLTGWIIDVIKSNKKQAL